MMALGIVPDKFVNHGPTVSLYYSDPDGNGIEFFVDRFPTMAGAKQFMRSETFRKNMVGYPLDPELLLKGQADGTSETELMAYDQDLADAAAAARLHA
jgi:catechol-2,3-dioxygenase